tara:strand:+ start:241 stop:807 length:567 start_codon:yes stop_codon:yes gene_type:complete
MMRLNHGIWIVFGTLSLFCMSYLGSYQVIHSPYLAKLLAVKELNTYKTNRLIKKTDSLNRACKAHSQEESFLRLRIAELEDLNGQMYSHSLNSNELVTFYDSLTSTSAENKLVITAMQSESIQLRGATILNLDLELEGQTTNLLSWLKAVEQSTHPMVVNFYNITNFGEAINSGSNLKVQLSILVNDE